MTLPEVESTLAIIKPDAYPNRDAIIAHIKHAGFAVAERKTITMDSKFSSAFYAEHKEKPFYPSLEEFMTSGPIEVMVLRCPEAISKWRELIGTTDPEKASPNTIRAQFGTNKTKNATHGSDSTASAQREIELFFPGFTPPKSQRGTAAQEYLSKHVTPVLEKALAELCFLSPSNPVEWLGSRLLRESGVGLPITKMDKPEKQQKRIFFVLGGPGSGKGTQCSKLVEKLGFDHFSAGDLLRAEVKSDSSQGKMIDGMIKEGKIVPGHITIGLLKNAIEKSEAPGILIDGFPRQLDQAGAFEKDVSNFEFVLFFDCPEEEMERRLLERGKTSGRSDDNIESIKKRFRTFIQTSMPVIEYYEAKGKVNRIDATQSIGEITEQVISLF